MGDGGDPRHGEVEDDKIGAEAGEEGSHVGLHVVNGGLEELGLGHGEVGGALNPGGEARDGGEGKGGNGDGGWGGGGEEGGDAGDVGGGGEESDAEVGVGGSELAGELDEGAYVAIGQEREHQDVEAIAIDTIIFLHLCLITSEVEVAGSEVDARAINRGERQIMH